MKNRLMQEELIELEAGNLSDVIAWPANMRPTALNPTAHDGDQLMVHGDPEMVQQMQKELIERRQLQQHLEQRDNQMMEQMQQMYAGLRQLGLQMEAVNRNQYNHHHAMSMAGIVDPQALLFPNQNVFPDSSEGDVWGSGEGIPVGEEDDDMEIGTEASYHFT